MTPKQEAYCQAVASGLSPADAAAKAGYGITNIGKQIGRLNTNPEVQKRISILMAAKGIPHNVVVAISKDTQEKIEAEAKQNKTALEFLRDTYNNPNNDIKVRVQAALGALPYEEAKIAPKGKKEEQVDNAKTATKSGKFATLGYQTTLDGDGFNQLAS